MKTLLGLLIACGALAVAQARPLVVQESARIANPDPVNFPYFAADVAIDGDDAIATLERYIDAPEGGDPQRRSSTTVAVHLFHRNRRRLGARAATRAASPRRRSATFDSALAMRNGIAALGAEPACTSSSGATATGCPRPSPVCDPAMPAIPSPSTARASCSAAPAASGRERFIREGSGHGNLGSHLDPCGDLSRRRR